MKFKCIIFDLDGTIYFGSELAEKANEVIEKARQVTNDNIFFLTNNSSQTRQEILLRLKNLGVDCKYSEVINSSYVMAKYLSKNGYKEVYCVGSESLRKKFSDFGINPVSKCPQAVIAGYYPDFTLSDLNELLNIDLSNYKLIIANYDRCYPGANGITYPAARPIISAVEGALDRPYDIIIGKPNPEMLKVTVAGLNFKPEEICMVGDSFESDIIMAKDYGARSILISEIPHSDADIQVKNLSEILEILE